MAKNEQKEKLNEILRIGDQCQEKFLPISSSKLEFIKSHGICFAGTSILKGDYEIRRKTNNAHLIHYTLSGTGWLEINGKQRTLSPGDIWISPDGTQQHYGLKGPKWQVVWFDLKDQGPWAILKNIGTCVRKSVMGARFKQLLEMLIWEFQDNRLHSENVIQHGSELLLAYLEREFKVEYDSKNFDVVNKLHKLFYEKVKSRLRYSWTVDSLADESEMFISADYFSKLCLKHMSMSPMKIVTRLRMESARDLLHSTYYSINKISELVGYTNYFAFSTAFKKRYGLSPRAFRYKYSI
ncbi:AraC family transcriptional regulator [Sedimentisphaera salicampi]|uniref:Arabinose operon regulatory protein n=1 Tax=Sedimentisphaera salicampi TaxID=1941349 RepID=A0A1W6LK54_9BACT|nr:AraC family transcriptional regulator [Sedimentisphaera salicampi]ARN56157.1 Arabinose operon regulatory protein [Sedimentisphaera salicampi]